MSDAIIITSIICVSVILLVSICCYTSHKKENGSNLHYIEKRINVIHDKLNNHYTDFYENRIQIKNSIDELKKLITK